MIAEDWVVIIVAGESRTVKFKSDRGPLSDTDLIDAVVCLANGSGGLLFVGVENDGTITGLHAKHSKRPDLLPSLVASRTVPPLAVNLRVASMETSQGTKPVAVLRVPESNQLVATSDGRVLMRLPIPMASLAVAPFIPMSW